MIQPTIEHCHFDAWGKPVASTISRTRGLLFGWTLLA
jgi:hypothetical protein